MLEVILALSVIFLALVVLTLQKSLKVERNARVALQNNVKDLLQQIADQVDASTDLITTTQDTFNTSLQTIDTKVHALAQVSGLILVNGLWQYETVVSAENQQKAKPAVKKSPVKKGVK